MLKRESFSGCFYPGLSTGFHGVPKPIDKTKTQAQGFQRWTRQNIYFIFDSQWPHIYSNPSQQPGMGWKVRIVSVGSPCCCRDTPWYSIIIFRHEIWFRTDLDPGYIGSSSQRHG